MDLEEEIIDSLQVVAVSSIGLIGIKLPDWITFLSNCLGEFEGFYKFIIFVLTTIFLLYRIKNEKTKKNNISGKK